MLPGRAAVHFEKTAYLRERHINAFRATEGKPPYTRWTSAEACSDGQAASDSMTGQAHHEGRSLSVFARRSLALPSDDNLEQMRAAVGPKIRRIAVPEPVSPYPYPEG